MTEATIDYIKSRVVSTACMVSGDILTECTVTFDNGAKVTGTSVRDISAFEKDEAAEAALNNAISGLSAGVEFILNKTS